MTGRSRPMLALAILSLLVAGNSLAQSSQNQIAYQGRLELDGTPQSGGFDFVFELFSSETAGECDTPTAECLWRDEFTGVIIYGGSFSVLLGSNAPLLDSVWQHDVVYLGIKVKQAGDPDYTPLTSRKRIVAVPYTARAATAKNYQVTGTLAVDGPIESHAITPKYQSWNSQGLGEGGAAIYNDSGIYKELMVVGNNSAGGDREIGLYDNVSITKDLSVTRNLAVGGSLDLNGDLAVNGTVTRSGCHWVTFAYTHLENPQYSCPSGEFVIGFQTAYAASYVDVYPAAMHCCKIGD
ncbi:MAG: hypothetical protein ABIJ09_03025 [Pseudomonadota bacterium]